MYGVRHREQSVDDDVIPALREGIDLRAGADPQAAAQPRRRMHNLEVGEREVLLSNFMNGVKRSPATWTPEQRKPTR
jgi:hypothetical protein